MTFYSEKLLSKNVYYIEINELICLANHFPRVYMIRIAEAFLSTSKNCRNI